MSTKRTINLALMLTLTTILLFFILILFQAVQIGVTDGEKWRAKGDSSTLQYRTVLPLRGNVYAANGEVIATSLPIFEVRFDALVENINNSLFNQKVDSIAAGLSQLLPSKSKATYKKELIYARKHNVRDYLIAKEVTFPQLKKIKKLPIFRLGRFKGGLVVIPSYKRQKPFGSLALRTIGDASDAPPRRIGIEGSFNNYLSGDTGKVLCQKIAGNVWKPVTDFNEIEAKDGYDIVTTLDVKIQDVAEMELKKQLEINNAEHGCVILMEVATGEIKALANLGKDKNGNYAEIYNYAIAEAAEPGSTFKLASLMAAMEDNLINENTYVDTRAGNVTMYGKTYSDGHPGDFNTVKKVFANSSNVGVIKLIANAYANNPTAFVNRIKSFGLGEKSNVQVKGEGNPLIKTPKHADWSKTSLYSMAIGYDCLLTPLQLLTFYNAVANRGKLMQPLLVTEVRNATDTIQRFRPTTLKQSICSEKTLKQAFDMLQEVVVNGTAKEPLKGTIYSVGGKTGTARISRGKQGYEEHTYRGSFVGFFPADKPKYSCIVVITNPREQGYYGGEVAAPIFKRVADLVYASTPDMMPPIVVSTQEEERIAPAAIGYQKELKALYNYIKVSTPTIKQEWEYVQPNNPSKAQVQGINFGANYVMPNLQGMMLKDVIYLLQKKGIEATITGAGKVIQQSPEPGVTIQPATKVSVLLGRK